MKLKLTQVMLFQKYLLCYTLVHKNLGAILARKLVKFLILTFPIFRYADTKIL